jgi:hypothetical protein
LLQSFAPALVLPFEAQPIPMVWFLERGAEFLVCKARQEGTAFELTLVGADGTERVERIQDPSELVTRLVGCQRDLRREGWRVLSEPERQRLIERL